MTFIFLHNPPNPTPNPAPSRAAARPPPRNFLAFLFFFLISGFGFQAAAYACTAGAMQYNSDYHVYQYCNGTNWYAMGHQSSGATTNGLVGWWKFDDGSGTTAADSSGTGNAGTFSAGGLAWTTSGKVNGALTFDGSSAVDVSDAASLDLAGSWTVAAWINLSALPAASSFVSLVEKGTAGGAATNYGLYVDNGAISAGLGWMIDYNSTGCCDDHFAKYTTSISTGTWYHVAGVYDSVAHTETLHLNGSQVAQSTGVPVPESSSGPEMALGATSSHTAPITGTLDDARVYNRALSATEIAALYTNTGGGSGCGATSSGLIGWWKLDETSGTSASDSSGQGNTGALTTGVTWNSSGKINGAVSDDGNAGHGINLGEPASLRPTGSMTITAWIKGASWPTSPNDASILDRNDVAASQKGYSLKAGLDCGPENLELSIATSATTNAKRCSNTVLSTGTWYFVAGVYDATAQTMHVYVNGVLDDGTLTAAVPSSQYEPPTGSGYNAMIGTNPDPVAGQSVFNGTIDDVRLYNRALSPSEITTLYNFTSAAYTASPEGALVYNNDYHVPQFCNGTQWVPMGHQGSGGPSSTGLVGWWKLDEGSGASAADASGNANTGALTNGPTWTTGKINSALTFNGTTQYVNVPDAASIRPTGSWTVTAWVNPASLPAGNVAQLVQKNNASGYSDYALGLDHNSACAGATNYGWRIRFNRTSDSAADTVTDCYGVPIPTGVWYHLAGVWDSAGHNLSLYVNGALITTTNFGANVPYSDAGGSFALGSTAGGSSSFFNGAIDDVRVYNRALSAAEIQQLYNATCTEGALLYNDAYHVFQFCDGTQWVPIDSFH